MKIIVGFAAPLLGLIGFVAIPSHAEGIHVESGEWEMTSTAQNPMGGSQTQTLKQCVNGEELQPDSFLKDVNGCTISDFQTSSTSMSWTMVCTAQGGKMQGDAQLNSSSGGKKIAGTMTMSASFNGETMNFARSWTGHWLGPCP